MLPNAMGILNCLQQVGGLTIKAVVTILIIECYGFWGSRNNPRMQGGSLSHLHYGHIVNLKRYKEPTGSFLGVCNKFPNIYCTTNFSIYDQ